MVVDVGGAVGAVVAVDGLAYERVMWSVRLIIREGK